MEVIKTLPAGQYGTKKHQRQWQDQLIAVRYRRDPKTHDVLTIKEIIVDRKTAGHAKSPGYRRRTNEVVALHIAYCEAKLRAKVKATGARYSKQIKPWITTTAIVRRLALLQRIVEGAAEKCLDVDTSYEL